MARKKAVLNFNTFVAGLNTEASPLNFPENCSFEEKNFVLDKDGGRRRRLGMELQGGLLSLSTFYEVTSRLYPIWSGEDFSVSPSFEEYEVTGKLAESSDRALITPSYLGYELGGLVLLDEPVSVSPSFLGAPLSPIVLADDNVGPTPSYIGAALGITTDSTDEADVAPSFLGATLE